MHNFELPFPADFLAGSSFKEGEREKQGKKKKAVAESAVKFALSVENFQCSRQGRKFNLRNRVGFQTKFQTFQRVSTFSVFSKAPPPPPLPPPYRNISILYHAYDLQYSSAHVTPADSSNTIFLFFRPFSLRSMRRCTSTSHFIRLSQRERERKREKERRLDCFHSLDVLTKLPVSCRSLSSTCLQREILPTRGCCRYNILRLVGDYYDG